MTSFTLKIIALITMLIDHAGVLFFKNIIYRIIGRIAFPLFAFQFVQSYNHTSNKKKFLKRLLIFAIISQIPFSLMMYISTKSFFALNIFWLFFFAGLILLSYEKLQNNFKGIAQKIIITIAIFTVCILLKVDYDYKGLLLILLIYFSRNIKILQLLSIIIFACITYFPYFYYLINKNYHSVSLLLYLLFTIIPGILILFYNGKKGRNLKYLFYFIYPLHILIFSIIYLIR